MNGVPTFRTATLSLGFLALAAVPARADIDCSALAPTGQTTKAVAGAKYKATGMHRFLFGTGYRELWAMPIEVPVLDLQRFAGGLTVKDKAGSKQTLGLKFEAANGLKYKFRSTDKRAEFLPEDLRKTFVQDVAEDQNSAQHPAGGVVASPLARAVGLPEASRCMVVMPDDPALGEHRKEFAGLLGTLEESLTLDPPTPGFENVEKNLDTTDDLFVLMDSSPTDRIDSRTFLKARLFDMWIGDWDRHTKQWEWVRRKGDTHWEPVPKDRDMAFSNFNGFLIALARPAAPRIVDFKPQYPRVTGFIANSRDQDRRLLADLEEPVWNDVVAELQRGLTDSVIDDAVARMPREYYAASGPALAAILKARRERLPELAKHLYGLFAREVDVFATAVDDVAEVKRLETGDVEVTVASLKERDTPYFRRHFAKGETDEIRVYLGDGNDRLVTSGTGAAGPTLRIVGGKGSDVYDERIGGGIHIYDAEGTDQVLGRKTDIDTRPYVEKLDKNGNRPLDSGVSLGLFPYATTSGDIGPIVGLGLRYQKYGFRAHPFRSRQTLMAQYATSQNGWRGVYAGEWHHTNSLTFTQLLASASQFEVVRFYGFGNETPISGPGDFHHVEQTQYAFAPSFNVQRGAAKLSLGAIGKYSVARFTGDRFIDSVRPYGTENFGQAGTLAGVELDTRDSKAVARRGVLLRAAGTVYPAVWSVRQTFGEAHGEAAVHVPVPAPLHPSLALRVGGKQVWGLYPFQEAAILGSRTTVRGLERSRYSGDAMLFSNAELRLHLGKLPWLPGKAGLFGLVDNGRVFLAGETSDRWHTGVGGGMWLAIQDNKNVVAFTWAKSEGHVSLSLKTALIF
jgi:hypothetical protein